MYNVNYHVGALVDKTISKKLSFLIGLIIVISIINVIIGLYFIEEIRLLVWNIIYFTPIKYLNIINSSVTIFVGSMVVLLLPLTITWSIAIFALSKNKIKDLNLKS